MKTVAPSDWSTAVRAGTGLYAAGRGDGYVWWVLSGVGGGWWAVGGVRSSAVGGGRWAVRQETIGKTSRCAEKSGRQPSVGSSGFIRMRRGRCSTGPRLACAWAWPLAAALSWRRRRQESRSRCGGAVCSARGPEGRHGVRRRAGVALGQTRGTGVWWSRPPGTSIVEWLGRRRCGAAMREAGETCGGGRRGVRWSLAYGGLLATARPQVAVARVGRLVAGQVLASERPRLLHHHLAH